MVILTIVEYLEKCYYNNSFKNGLKQIHAPVVQRQRKDDCMLRTDILSQKETILKWVDEGLTKREMSRRLSCDIKTVDSYLNLFGVEYHGNQGAKGYKTFKSPQYLSFDEYIKVGAVQTNKLRIKLLKEGLKQPVCERCGNSEWQGQPIPLEVHHIDGNKKHNKLNNLQLLCPNCHALTPTYRGKNIKTYSGVAK